MNKLAVTVWNYKGGVGESTIALILAEIAASKGLHVVAADLDEQQNLAKMLNLAKNPIIEVRNSLPEYFEFLTKTMREFLTVKPFEMSALQQATIVREYADEKDVLLLFQILLEETNDIRVSRCILF